MTSVFNIVFLIGLEGTGHHLFADSCNFKETRLLHRLLLEYFDTSTNIDVKSKIKNRIYDFTKHNTGKVHIDRASFPFGRPTNPLKCYDILEFYELFNSMPHVSLFFIVLIRDIVRSTLSSHNRFDKSKSIILSARQQENCLIYINSQIQLIPERVYVIVDFNDIVNNISDFEKVLLKKSGMTITFDPSKIKLPDDSKHLRDNNYNYLKNYFGEVRTSQFSFLYNNAHSFAPLS